MIKGVKRISKTKISGEPESKLPKYFNFINLTKDVSVLRTFYDFIDNDEFDVIDEYLSKHDFNDFLNYFSLHHLYKPDEFCLIYQVTTEILMRIASDLNSKHTLSGQAFSETFMNKYKPIVYTYLRNNKSNRRLISCLKFVTALVLQSKDIALKVATEIDFMKANLVNLLNIRKLKDEEDVHTSVVNLYGSFFVMSNNHLIRKICEDNILLSNILKDLRFERLHNVQLIIEILHDKIVKNSSVSKTAKVKMFNVSNLRFLLAVFEWKGEAVSFDAFKNLNSINEKCNTIYDQLYSLLCEVCTSYRLGIAFVDNLLCQSQQGSLNKKLFYFITSESMMEFFTNSYKLDLVMSILTACPDLVNKFIDHLVAIMMNRKPEFRGEILNYIVKCYRLLDCSKINNILTEAWNYNKGDKFIDIALILCQPSKTLMEFLQAEENIHIASDESVIGLRNTLFEMCEKVITWINVTDVIYCSTKKSELRQNLQDILLKNLSACGWEYELNILFTEDFLDHTLFSKQQAEKVIDNEDEEDNMEKNVDNEIRTAVEELRKVESGDEIKGKNILKEIYQHFISSTDKSIYLLKLIGEAMLKKEILLKKKYKRLLTETLTTNDFFSEHWSLFLQQDELYNNSELKRNYILDIVIHFVSQSKGLRNIFFEHVHPLKLLSVYGASLSHSDQKILYLLILQLSSGPVYSDYNFTLFGNVVTEHYFIEKGKSPNLRRPIVNSQCLNLIDDENLNTTIQNFPLNRSCPVAKENNSLNLVPSQPNIYDPYFLLEWISQLILVENENNKMELACGINVKSLFSKQIISFLIICLTSENRYIRRMSRLHLEHFITILNETEENETDFPMKFQLQMLIFHVLNSTNTDKNTPGGCVKLSSVFVNYYLKLLKLVASPGKVLHKPLFEMFMRNSKFDLRYVPDFLQLMYSNDIDARLRQGWCLGLLADSVKSIEDFHVILDSKVLTHVFSLYRNCEQNIKRIILSLIKSCVSIDKAAPMLYKFPQFLMWLLCVTNSNEERQNRSMLVNIIQLFVASLKRSEWKKVNFDELEKNFTLIAPEINFNV